MTAIVSGQHPVRTFILEFGLEEERRFFVFRLEQGRVVVHSIDLVGSPARQKRTPTNNTTRTPPRINSRSSSSTRKSAQSTTPTLDDCLLHREEGHGWMDGWISRRKEAVRLTCTSCFIPSAPNERNVCPRVGSTGVGQSKRARVSIEKGLRPTLSLCRTTGKNKLMLLLRSR